MSKEQLAAIREAANELTRVAKYVEAASPTGAAVILCTRDRILRLLDEAEKDGVTTLSCVENGNRFVRPNYTCRKCGRVMEYPEPCCPGCGRRIEGGGEG